MPGGHQRVVPTAPGSLFPKKKKEKREKKERVSWREAIFRLWNLWNPARAVRAPMNFAKFNFSLTSAISAYILLKS